MSMTPEHYEKVRVGWVKVANEDPEYVREGLRETPEHTRWNVYWVANDTNEHIRRLRLYDYLNDDQIDTALRRIAKDWLDNNPDTPVPVE